MRKPSVDCHSDKPAIVMRALSLGKAVAAAVAAVALLPLATEAFAVLAPARIITQHRMFTGIVEEMGTVMSLEERDDMVLWDGTTGKGTELTVKGNIVMDGAYLG